jgi:methylenetetrahydrofolate dehydrogenase (NADP+)/methenyltetrahydrofolate cyclohydrolase
LAELLKGAVKSRNMYAEFLVRTDGLKKSGIVPKICIFIASDNAGSEIYASMIVKNCSRAGIECDISRSGPGTTANDLADSINKANYDDSVHGIIVMLPLWKGIDEKKILATVSPDKDIDGVSPLNAGKLVLGDACFHPSTAEACVELLYAYGYDPAGKHVVILGRSNIVGKPLANILVQKGVDATVTVCHSRTQNLKKICRSADILIAAIGSPKFITEDYTHSEQIIIDVGMNEIIDGEGNVSLSGDVDFDNVKDKVKAITPVPGGVSPFTHISLIKNILKAIELKNI